MYGSIETKNKVILYTMAPEPKQEENKFTLVFEMHYWKVVKRWWNFHLQIHHMICQAFDTKRYEDTQNPLMSSLCHHWSASY